MTDFTIIESEKGYDGAWAIIKAKGAPVEASSGLAALPRALFEEVQQLGRTSTTTTHLLVARRGQTLEAAIEAFKRFLESDNDPTVCMGPKFTGRPR